MSPESHNRHAGQGPVVLDIGGDVGAVVVFAPAALAGREIEAVPVDRATPARHASVVERRAGAGTLHAVVVDGLPPGEYDLRLLPDGAPVDRVTVDIGEVTRARWPGAEGASDSRPGRAAATSDGARR